MHPVLLLNRALAASLAWAALALCSLPGTDLRAQSMGQVQSGFMPPATWTAPGLLPTPPAVPAAKCERVHPTTPPIPVQSGRGLPPGPESFADAGPRPLAPNVFVNTALSATATASSTSLVGEPACAQQQDAVLMTGNWYASISGDHGKSWGYVNPYTKFPAVDGGFCCDQYTVHVPQRNFTAWYLQYMESAATGWGSFRLAVANSTANLKNAAFYYWTFNPSAVGYGTGHWFDFPHVAISNNWLYVTSNIFTLSPYVYKGTTCIKMPLLELSTGAGFTYHFYNQSLGTWRLTHGATDRMFWGQHTTTVSMRIYQWIEATNQVMFFDRPVGAWYTGTMSSIGPDGRDWLGRDDHRIKGGFDTGSRVGFMWNSNAGLGFPQPFVRIETFDRATLLNTGGSSVWNGTYAWAFPSCAVAANGDIGGTISAGGGGAAGQHPSSYCWLFDAISPTFAPLDNVFVIGGTNGPGSNVWGDYFSTERHPVSTYTFVGTSMAVRNGTGNANQTPNFTWFGRAANKWADVPLQVTSTPVTGVPITVDQTDLGGLKNGTTNFTRTFAARQGYTLTAPASHVSGATTYLFRDWVLNGTPQAAGQVKLAVADIGGTAHSAQARFDARRNLSVTSLNPASGVAITVSLADLNNLQNGTTAFSRQYRNGTSVTLTAPAAIGANPLRYWRVNGVPGTVGLTTANLPMTADTTAEAIYFQHTSGTFTTLGAGCRGTNGRVPVHTAIAKGGEPNIGVAVNFELSQARAFTPAAFYFGGSKSVWGAFKLPLDLTFIGMAPCFLYQSIDNTVGVTTDGSGAFSLPVTIPNNPALIGGHVYTTFAIVDIGATKLGIVHSNALDTLVGGNQ